ncbi:H-type small acid-soluble spore protein [Caldisalinibacter kiritimatiensis]|uniref:Uncharacterized protein n=1 Tax=Caldisalinibacter kiritimatiensis TaxID=1304284 RepID=R1CDE3_9FIRM|nr:H-type small acid-soluble spore protein [Caldisalinibacter kiritimatiensis]EOD00310.1 hypothetical protein L21TH_1609 [Caldisalinibacter kiritimatiensis]
MDIDRAYEILNSPKKIEVTYNNTPVWIEGINKQKGTANIKMLSNNTLLEVNTNSLTETGNLMKS